MNSVQGKPRTNKHFYDCISGAYDDLADANEHVAREMGERLLNPQPGERVLEIGFGTGNSLLNLADQVGEEGAVCGVDVSEGMRKVTQEKLDKQHRINVELYVGSATMLPCANSQFDAAFMSFTLELFSEEDTRKVLNEINRVLKPGGRLSAVGMALVADGEKESFLEKTYQWMHRHFPHIVDCRPIDFAATLQENGFTVIAEERMAIWTMPVAAVVGSAKP